jgi:hypothetical protein
MRRTTGAAGAALAAAALAAVTTAPAADAAARATTTPTVVLASHATSVTTSTGKALYLRVLAQSTSGGQTAIVTLGTSSSLATGERHSWTFNLAGGSLTYTASDGSATLSTGTQLSPYGSLSLKFTKSAKSSVSCDGGADSITTESGTLTGTVNFVTNTGSNGWGAVSKKTFSFTTPNHLVVNSCQTQPPVKTPTAACHTGWDWVHLDFAGASTPSTIVQLVGSTYTTSSGTANRVDAMRMKRLSSPSGAMRTDEFTATNVPAVSVSKGVMTVKGNGGRITGSATLTSTSTGGAMTNPCGSGHTQVDTPHQANWQKTATYTVHLAVTPAITTTATGSMNGYDRLTVK